MCDIFIRAEVTQEQIHKSFERIQSMNIKTSIKISVINKVTNEELRKVKADQEF